jgi:inner membrane protein
MSFGLSYAIAAAASIASVSLYSKSILKGGRRTLIITIGLAVIYGFLYVILQMQDYSLLFGTIGLFILLGLVMYSTRNIDWYKRDLE